MDPDTRLAVFRSKLRQKSEKRLDHPFAKYSEQGQLMCKVCNVTLQSESLWDAHQISKKHKEAVEALRALKVRASKTEAVKTNSFTDAGASTVQSQSSTRPASRNRPSSALPSDFFDKPEAKRHCPESDGRVAIYEKDNGIANSHEQTGFVSNDPKVKKGFKEPAPVTSAKSPLGNASVKEAVINPSLDNSLHNLNHSQKSEEKQVKGSLPEGFFDNKEADLRARGLKPVKIDSKEEWKEFQKTIQEDLQEVDDRLDEEEYEAAEVREKMDLIEQREYVERVRMLKNKKREMAMARASAEVKSLSFMNDESSDDSEDEDTEENDMSIDWRAKHL